METCREPRSGVYSFSAIVSAVYCGVCQVRREMAAVAAESVASNERTPPTVNEVSRENSSDRSDPDLVSICFREGKFKVIDMGPLLSNRKRRHPLPYYLSDLFLSLRRNVKTYVPDVCSLHPPDMSGHIDPWPMKASCMTCTILG